MANIGRLFEDSLLIIKADYMHKRKQVLLMLLQNGFQIQGHRRIHFSPEQAAEFYNDIEEEKSFMLQVILLSKSVSEAFILARENCVSELLKTMICYFITSDEMERNIHVSKTKGDVRREIQFIFANYIHEPIAAFDRYSFCRDRNIQNLINELYNIAKDGRYNLSNWRERLVEWLERTNSNHPEVSNMCNRKPLTGSEDKGVQVKIPEPVQMPCFLAEPATARSGAEPQALVSFSASSAHSSMLYTTSSCVSCSGFVDEPECPSPPVNIQLSALIATKTQEVVQRAQTPPMTICDVDWHELTDQVAEESLEEGVEEEEENIVPLDEEIQADAKDNAKEGDEAPQEAEVKEETVKEEEEENKE